MMMTILDQEALFRLCGPQHICIYIYTTIIIIIIIIFIFITFFIIIISIVISIIIIFIISIIKMMESPIGTRTGKFSSGRETLYVINT